MLLLQYGWWGRGGKRGVARKYMRALGLGGGLSRLPLGSLVVAWSLGGEGCGVNRKSKAAY